MSEKNTIHPSVHEKLLADGWLPVTDAQKDGELYLLLIISDEHEKFDDSAIGRVIGSNHKIDTDEDTWQLAGWNWNADEFINISIEPQYYKELPAGLTISLHELEHGLED